MYQQRLVYIIDSLGAGGAERALLNLLPELCRQYQSVAVIALFADTELLEEYLAQDITVIELKLSRRWNLFKNTLVLARILKAQRADILHAHLIFSGIYLGLTRLLGVRGRRFITFHNLAYAKGCNPRNFSYFLRKGLNWILLNLFYSGFVAVSAAVADHYSRNLRIDRARIAVIGNGLVASEFKSRPLGADSANKPVTIMSVGRLVPEKGYSYLLEAFGQLCRRSDRALRLQIIGDGPLRENLALKCASLGLSDRVDFCGAMAHDQVIDKLATADCFVLASVFEGFGLAVAEAMMVQLPVVVTNVGGIRDVVDPAFAEIVEAADVHGLAEAIEHVLALDARQLEQRVTAAQDHVKENFSSHSIARQLGQVYRCGA